MILLLPYKKAAPKRKTYMHLIWFYYNNYNFKAMGSLKLAYIYDETKIEYTTNIEFFNLAVIKN